MLIPLGDYELDALTFDEVWNLWHEIQAEADRLDEILSDEDRWKEEKRLRAWVAANTYENATA